MKLTVPSYVYPGTWRENLDELVCEKWIAGVELLMFSFDAESRKLFFAELPHIKQHASRFELSLHLPYTLDVTCEELIEKTRSFVEAYVVHPPRADASHWAELLRNWMSQYGDVFLMEYTRQDEFAAGLHALPDMPLCADTGALLRDGKDPAQWALTFCERIRQYHVHDFVDGKEHSPITSAAPWLAKVVALAKAGQARFELELFSMSMVRQSWQALQEVINN